MNDINGNYDKIRVDKMVDLLVFIQDWLFDRVDKGVFDLKEHRSAKKFLNEIKCVIGRRKDVDSEE